MTAPRALDELVDHVAERDAFLHLLLALWRLGDQVDDALRQDPPLARAVDVPEELIDALLGAVALRRTWAAILGSGITEPAERPPAARALADWDREDLR